MMPCPPPARPHAARNGLIAVLLCVCLICLSVFGFANWYNPESCLQALDEKKELATKITSIAAAASAVIAVVPDDSTTPIANQIMSISSYMIAAISALLAEKLLVNCAGCLVYQIFFPLLCLFVLLFYFLRTSKLKPVILILLVLSLCLRLLIPISVFINSKIDEALNTNQIVAEIVEVKQAEEASAQEETGFFQKASNFFSNIFSTVSNAAELAEQWFLRFVNAISAMILTAFVVPLLTFLLLWVVLSRSFKSIADLVLTSVALDPSGTPHNEKRHRMLP